MKCAFPKGSEFLSQTIKNKNESDSAYFKFMGGLKSPGWTEQITCNGNSTDLKAKGHIYIYINTIIYMCTYIIYIPST